MVVILLILILCCMMFGGEEVKGCLGTIVAFLLILSVVGNIFC